MTHDYHAALVPFIRNGRAVPLTASEYGDVFDLERRSAGSRLVRLIRAGMLTSSQVDGSRAYVYELTPEGLNIALDKPSASPLAFDADKQLTAVAKRAFGGPIDVRPLLPVYEVQIGEMMRRSVPRQFRPTQPIDRADIAAYRRAHAARVRARAGA